MAFTPTPAHAGSAPDPVAFGALGVAKPRVLGGSGGGSAELSSLPASRDLKYLFQCFFIFIKYLAKNHLCSCQTLGEQPRVAAVTLNVGFVDPFLFCSWFLERWEEGDQQHLKGASQPFPDGYGQE